MSNSDNVDVSFRFQAKAFQRSKGWYLHTKVFIFMAGPEPIGEPEIADFGPFRTRELAIAHGHAVEQGITDRLRAKFKDLGHGDVTAHRVDFKKSGDA